jgi:large subunit ribosomal protein L4
MTLLNLTTIDFNKDLLFSSEIKVPFDLEVESPKSIAYAIRWQLAKRRSGSAKVKTMSEISGTTAKPHKQKGTGRARQGSKRSVQFVGGRTCHGPMPRSFEFSIPKKIAKKAILDTLKLKLKNNKIILFDKIQSEIKTAKISQFLKKNNFNKNLIILDPSQEGSSEMIKSVKNLKDTKTISLKAINAYDMLNFNNIIFDKRSFEISFLDNLVK